MDPVPAICASEPKMKQMAVLPRNFFRRHEIRALVPSLKTLLTVMCVGCESHVGCWIPGDLAKDSGLEDEGVAGGLIDLQRRNLIFVDEKTSEIFIADWFRNNKFAGIQRGLQAISDFRVVESVQLKNRILEAIARSPECGLTVEFLSSTLKKQDVKHQVEVKEKVEVKPPPPQEVDEPPTAPIEVVAVEFPPNLKPEIHRALMVQLRQVAPGDQQALIDDLAGWVATKFAAGDHVRNPAAAFRPIVTRYLAGEWVGESSHVGAALRARHRQSQLPPPATKPTIDPAAKAAGEALLAAARARRKGENHDAK